MVVASSFEVGLHDRAAAATNGYFDRTPAVPAICTAPDWEAAGNGPARIDPRCPAWTEQVRGVKLVRGHDVTGGVSGEVN